MTTTIERTNLVRLLNDLKRAITAAERVGAPSVGMKIEQAKDLAAAAEAILTARQSND
ncbi:hypothetical protein [Azospirillum soli]|uniref:hypothetical protein n=1 Tax=Azospirillum soli TaxID=1304799 RepID=UPI001AE65903|nr:hypothetical protein [Azospirillum soli]MBP2316805.1 hypothetical protein [Azospirillum soli]